MEGLRIAAQAAFFLSLAGALLVFPIYPAALWLLARLRPSPAGAADGNDGLLAMPSGAAVPAGPIAGDGCLPAQRSDPLPSVSLVTVARNAESLLAEKLENSLALDYPPGLLEVVAYSDGSLDHSAEILRGFEARGVRVLVEPEHRGKAHGLNAAAAAATGSVLVFSDADALLEPGALRALVAPLADPRVGGACGLRVLARDDAPLGEAQRSYIGFDSWIKRLESRLGRITSNDGKLYAVRRELFRPVDPGATDDLFAALSVVAQGRGFVFAPEARARIRLPSRDAGHELARRRRIVARSLRGIAVHRALLNPLRYGIFAVGLLVNKVLRRLLPIFLIGMAAGAAGMANDSLLARAALAATAAVLALAAADPLLARIRVAKPLTRIAGRARYALLGLCGTLLGLIDFCRGRTIERWDPRKTDGPAAVRASAAAPVGGPSSDAGRAVPAAIGTEPAAAVSAANGAAAAGPDAFPPGRARVAYIVSRFPKLTETFVLQEILELERLGLAVDIYPLQRGRESVTHPEVARVASRVRHQPLLSRSVIAANLAALSGHPRTCAGAAWECFRGTLGSLRFMAGALAFFPKAVWIARELQRRGTAHVHAHFAHHPALAALVVHRLTGIPFSFTAHGSDLHMDQRMLDRKIAAAAFAVTISDYNREFVRERCGTAAADKLQVVRCGIDPEVFTPRPAGREPGRFTILCIAALRGVKGHRHLIDACRRLRERGLDFEARLAGDGPLRAELERRIREAGLEGSVTLLGSLPRPEVVAELGRASVLVLPSVIDAKGRREGIPVVLMEGMACGLPVIASRLSGIPELVEDGREGLLVEPGDDAGLADALARVSADPDLRARLGGAAREKVRAQYDQRTNAARLAGLLRGAAGENSTGPGTAARPA